MLKSLIHNFKMCDGCCWLQQAHSKLRSFAWHFMQVLVAIPILAVDLAASTSGIKQPPTVSTKHVIFPSYTIHDVMITYKIPESISRPSRVVVATYGYFKVVSHHLSARTEDPRRPETR
jgi:hypothetical protein